MSDLQNFNDDATKVPNIKEMKYLTFKLAKEAYGIGIKKVKEIIGMLPITTVPQTPEYVEGVINLRGKVIPIMDLRTRFGIERSQLTDRTCIIVVEILREGNQSITGIVVDEVSDVLNVKHDQIEMPPDFGGRIDHNYILGMAKVEGELKILLDIDLVLSAVAQPSQHDAMQDQPMVAVCGA